MSTAMDDVRLQTERKGLESVQSPCVLLERKELSVQLPSFLLGIRSLFE